MKCPHCNRTIHLRTTAAEEKKIVEMYLAGVPYKVIAHEVGRSEPTINRTLKKYKVQETKKRNIEQLVVELSAAGVTDKRIAKEIGKSTHTVARMRNKLGLYKHRRST